MKKKNVDYHWSTQKKNRKKEKNQDPKHKKFWSLKK